MYEPAYLRVWAYFQGRSPLRAGRWKGALIAVKVMDHMVKGNSSNAVDIQRETSLSVSLVHPNVVSIVNRQLSHGWVMVHIYAKHQDCCC